MPLFQNLKEYMNAIVTYLNCESCQVYLDEDFDVTNQEHIQELVNGLQSDEDLVETIKVFDVVVYDIGSTFEFIE